MNQLRRNWRGLNLLRRISFNLQFTNKAAGKLQWLYYGYILQMKNVLLLVTKDDVGGAQKYVRDLADNLDKSRFRAKILTGGKGGVRFLSNRFLPHFLFANDILAALEMFFIFRRERPDILHLNSSKAGVIGALAAWLYKISHLTSNISRVKVIFTAHGWVFNPDNNLSELRRQFYILAHKLAALFQSNIINVSEYDRQLALRERIATSEKLVTIRNGINHQIDFLDKTLARKELIKKLSHPTSHISPQGVWVGSIGRLVAEKDYITLIEASKEVPVANFFIIGSGPLKKLLDKKIKIAGLQDRFFIVEGLAPAASYLKAFDLFVLSSVKEGLPYTLLEAMAAALPVVVTRVGGMKELVEGRGLVMPPREPSELARAINHFLANPNEAVESARRGNDFLKNNLTLDKAIALTEKIYLA